MAAPNPYYANLLLEDYAGAVSELTAINQYLHHAFVFHEGYPDLVELEECISISEMKHLELLAETILKLGVDPQFRTLSADLPVYWNASAVYYGCDIADRLAADIAAEIQAIQNYRLHQQLIEDAHIKQMLERIILDEEVHTKLFREAYAKYSKR